MTDEEEIMLARSQVVIDARRVVDARDRIYANPGARDGLLIGELEDALIVLRQSLRTLDGWRRRMNEGRKGEDA